MDRPAADRRTARAQAGHIEVEFLQQVERENGCTVPLGWLPAEVGPDGREPRRRLRARRQRPRRAAHGRKELAPSHPSPRKDARLAQHANFAKYQTRRRDNGK